MRIEKIGLLLGIIGGILLIITPLIPAAYIYIYNVSGYILYWMWGFYYVDVYEEGYEELAYSGTGYVLDPIGIVCTIILISAGFITVFFSYWYWKGDIDKKKHGNVLITATIISFISLYTWMIMNDSLSDAILEGLGIDIDLSFWDVFNNSPSGICGIVGSTMLIMGAMISFMSTSEGPLREEKPVSEKDKVKKEQKAKKVKSIKCNFCGEANDPDDKFCINCGRDLTSKPQVKACPNCGEKIKAKAQFCGKCGYTI